MKSAARRLTPRRAANQPEPAPKVAPHPVPVVADPTGTAAVRNVEAERRALDDIAASVPAKLRPAHL